MNTMITISLRENPPFKYEDISTLDHLKSMAAQYSIRPIVHTPLQYIPGELSSNCNMIYHILGMINWQ